MSGALTYEIDGKGLGLAAAAELRTRVGAETVEARAGHHGNRPDGPGSKTRGEGGSRAQTYPCRPSTLPPLTAVRGGGWVWFVQAQPLQPRVQRLFGEIAAPLSVAFKPVRSAKFGGLFPVLRRLDPRRDGNREGVGHVHRLFVVHGRFGMSVPGLETFS